MAERKAAPGRDQVSSSRRKTIDEFPSLKTQMSLSEKICAPGCVLRNLFTFRVSVEDKRSRLANPHSPARESATMKALTLMEFCSRNLKQTCLLQRRLSQLVTKVSAENRHIGILSSGRAGTAHILKLPCSPFQKLIKFLSTRADPD